VTTAGGAPPRRARLELLVRRDGDEAFDLREIGSAAAFVQSRPQRVSADTFELAPISTSRMGQASYILKNTVTERYLLLSEPEKFLWEQMDGQTSMQDIATTYVLKYGAFDFDIIPALMKKLQRAQLLTLTPTSRLRQALARNRRNPVVKYVESALFGLERINVSSRKVQPFFGALYRWGGFVLFTPAATVVVALLAAIGLVAGVRLWQHADDTLAGFGASPVAAIVSVKLLFLFTVAAHQLLHGLALVHYNRRVREFGFTFLHGFVPTFYVDCTDIFMGTRRARVVTAISGALVHLVLGSLWFIAGTQLAAGSFWHAFAAASGMLQWQAFVVALYPFCFIEMDGYHVLVDVLGVPTLKQDALAYAAAAVRGRAPGRFTRLHALWVTYVIVSAVSVAGFMAFNVWLIIQASS